MKDEPTIPEGWIRHDGGPCPVADDEIVWVAFRNGQFTRPTRAAFWKGMQDQWRHMNRDYDIIAYKPEQRP